MGILFLWWSCCRWCYRGVVGGGSVIGGGVVGDGVMMVSGGQIELLA